MTSTPSRALVPVEFDVLEAAVTAVFTVAAGADQWDAGLRRVAMARVRRQLDAMTALHLKLVAAEQRAGTWGLRGDRDLAGFVGRESHQGRGAAMAVVAQAATLEAMPAVANALVDGPVTVTHVAQIARATAVSPKLAAELATSDGQAKVVELARRLDGSEFGRQLQAMGASLDPASRQRSHDEQRANRFLNISHTAGGTLVKGQLDSVAGYMFAKMIDAFNPRPAVDDERSRGQRQADALMVAVDRMLAEKDAAGAMVAPVQAVITLSEDTWAALRAVRDGEDLTAAKAAPRRSRTGSAVPPGSTAEVVNALTGVTPVVDETGQAWPASEVGRALCDCALTRAVVGARGEPLDLGRETRLFKRAHWVALYAAGARSCSMGGCGIPMAFTELHHMTWWHQQGGRTDIANCVPYCSFHHHEVHRWGLLATRRADGGYEHRHPDGRPYCGALPESRTEDPPRDLLALLPA